MKQIAITCSNGWFVKNFVYTNVIEQLSREAKITILSSHNYLHFLRIHYEKNTNVIVEHNMACKESWFQFVFRLLYKLSYMKKNKLEPEFNKASGRLPFILRKIVCCVFSVPLFAKLTSDLTMRVLSFRTSSIDLSRYEKILFTSPFSPHELMLSRNAVGVQTKSTFIPSWDNLTTKGVLYGKYDQVLTWGKAISETLLELYPSYYDYSKVTEVGIPQFDIYSSLLAKSHNKQSQGKRVLLYATSGPSIFPNEPHLVEKLIKFYEKRSEVTFVVRLHPNEQLSRYAFLHDFSCEVQITNNKEADLADWFPKKNSNQNIGDTLKRVDVCIAMVSTMMLDSLAMKTPCVSVGIELLEGHRNNIEPFYRYHHLRKFFSRTNTPVAYSFDELLSLINSLCSKGAVTPDDYIPNLGGSCALITAALLD